MSDLYKFVAENFDLSEIEDLTIELNVDFENLRGGGKSGKARALQQLMSRHGRLGDLITAVAYARDFFDPVQYLDELLKDYIRSGDEFISLCQSLKLDGYQPLQLSNLEIRAFSNTSNTIKTEKIQSLHEYVIEQEIVGNLLLYLSQNYPRMNLVAYADIMEDAKPSSSKPTSPSKGGSSQEPVPTTAQGLQYENFDLRILTKDSDNIYRIQVGRNPENMETNDVKQTFPLDDYDFTDLVDYLSDLIAKGSDAKELGRMMRDLLFPGQIGEIFFANMNSMRRQGKGLRIRLRIDAPELSKLPWEYCYSNDFGFFALDPRTPLVRYVGRPFQSPTLAVPNPMRVLLVIAAPTDQAPLSVGEEEQRIRQWLSVMGNRVELDVVSGRSTAQKMRAALGNNPQIVHFIGHGEFVNNLGRLVFEDDYRLSAYQDSEQLRVMLAGRDVKVVILNACKSAAGNAHAAFAGVAPALVEADIPAVIAMQFNVPDKTALGFTKDLYRYLMSGYPLDQAVTEMRSGAYGSADDKYFWGIPALYMRSQDGRLWEADAELLAKFEETRQSAADLAGPTLADLLQQIKNEVNTTSDIDDRDKDYIMRGLDDGLKAINESNVRDVEYYLSRAIEDLKRSRSETAEKKIVPKVESVIRQAKEELG